MPNGYFTGSERRLRNRFECAAELRSFPALDTLKGVNPFVVPRQFFEESAAIISRTSRRHQDTGFSEPPAYFLLQGIKLSERLTDYSYSEESEFGFSVPERYFENNGEEIRRKISTTGRIIRPSFTRAVSLATAAMLLIVAGIWLYRSVSAPVEEECVTVACLDRKDVLRSGALDNLNEEDLMLIIDGDDLEEELMLEDLQPETGPTDSSRKGPVNS